MNKFQLPRVKPLPHQVTPEFLNHQHQTLAIMQNCIRMGLIAVTELDTKFQNPENNRLMQAAINNLYTIIRNIETHPKYGLKADNEAVEDASAVTYELNKHLIFLNVPGITALTNSIKQAIQQDQPPNQPKL